MIGHGDSALNTRTRYGAHFITAALALSLPLAGCKKEEKPAEPEKKVEAVKPAEPKPTATATTAAAGSSDPECIGAWTVDGAAEKRDVAGKAFELQGARVKETSTDADDQIVIGVLANTKEDTADNLKNIASIVEFFKAEKAEAIIVDGDLGDTAQQIANVLEPIAAAGLPTFVIIGNQETKPAYAEGLKTVAAKHPGVFDLTKTRLAVLDDVALVSLPGYFNKSYIHVENGCHYKPSDVEATRAIVREAGDKPVVFVSHGGPQQKGPDALDWTAEGANVGDPELAKLLAETGVKFGVFANIRESGGHGTNLDGTLVIGENKPSPELFLNPGPADAVGWKMNDRTESRGMAATLTIKGRQGSFKVWRHPAS